jgi:hypothetical protein
LQYCAIDLSILLDLQGIMEISFWDCNFIRGRFVFYVAWGKLGEFPPPYPSFHENIDQRFPTFGPVAGYDLLLRV